MCEVRPRSARAGPRCRPSGRRAARRRRTDRVRGSTDGALGGGRALGVPEPPRGDGGGGRSRGRDGRLGCIDRLPRRRRGVRRGRGHHGRDPRLRRLLPHLQLLLRPTAVHVHDRRARWAAQPVPPAVRRGSWSASWRPSSARAPRRRRPRARGPGPVRRLARAGDAGIDPGGADPDRGGPAPGGGVRARVGRARSGPAREQLVADTSPTARAATPRRQRVLQRMPGDEPARWVVVHRPGAVSKAAGPVDTLSRQDRGQRRRPGLDLGPARPGRDRARPDADKAPRRRPRTRSARRSRGPDRRGGPGGRARPPRRRREVLAAPVGLARLPDAAAR